MQDPPDFVLEFARAIAEAGGRALLVGGCVRDRLLGVDSKDFDLEVSRLGLDELEEVLSSFGKVSTIGRSFGVLMVHGYGVDFCVPRRDNRIGRTHKDFRCELDPFMSFEEAARRRDLSINSMGLDPLTGEIFDPMGGRQDLRERRLRATDPGSFQEDPLRALRVAQFIARLEFAPDPELQSLCAAMDLGDLPGERLWSEFKKLLLLGRKPSAGLEFLREAGLLRFFPELQAMIDVPQDAKWHPEGPVWEHTLMVVDEAAALRSGDVGDDLLLMYGALCHDLGKPATTLTDAKGRVRSPNHSEAGLEPTARFMERLRAPHDLVRGVKAMVLHHLAPSAFTRQNASPRAYRRLARKLGAEGVSTKQLELVARADFFGRTTPESLAREDSSGPLFLAQVAQLSIEHEPEPAVVQGRHLLARGLAPGVHFKVLLERCREIQEETGLKDSQQILERYETNFGPLEDAS